MGGGAGGLLGDDRRRLVRLRRGTGRGRPDTDLTASDEAARVFVYDGPVAASLVFLHGSPDADHGGTAEFAFSGLSRDAGEWALRDDPLGTDDDFEAWANGNQRVNWSWGPGDTDGGVFYGGLDRQDFTVSMTPKTLHGVGSWRFLSGDGPDRIDLSTEKAAYLKPLRDRSVARANVDVMPDSEENEFDPYANEERITVAVRAPPEDAEGEWVGPDDIDPGNYSVNFGSKSYLAGGNAAQPQQYMRRGDALYLQYKVGAANFSLDSAYGYLVGKAGERTWFRGRDVVRPGGYDNTEGAAAGLAVSALSVGVPEDAPLNDEWVEFTNGGSEPLDLTGYTVSTPEGWAFHLPDGFTLDPDASVRLHTGNGEYGPDDLYWDLDSHVWPAEGVVSVTDADGGTVLDYGYPRT
ncbi:lamin tail domain-containing protein [Halosegnis marinus]|uniref:lamin tail domain-containing protein n=1 Tax=Halosegnis marinus TaxID=3034023 RepID=UPI0036119F42